MPGDSDAHPAMDAAAAGAGAEDSGPAASEAVAAEAPCKQGKQGEEEEMIINLLLLETGVRLGLKQICSFQVGLPDACNKTTYQSTY